MASSSGTTSGSTLVHNSGSEEDLQQLMDQRKRKRMISNRESARRSRMRKQKHLDDLMAQGAHLRKENGQIIASMNVTTQHYLNVEAENSVLKAQVAELTHRLESLNEIISFLGANSNYFGIEGPDCNYGYLGTVAEYGAADGIINGTNSSLNSLYASTNLQPIMADMWQ